MSHVIGVAQLGLERMRRILDLASRMSEVCDRPIPKVQALRGRTVCSLFLEDSTRTRLSFEMAARRLAADTLTFSASNSSLSKGESLRDTVETLSEMRVDAFVVRHRAAGFPESMTRWTDAVVINAGDGANEHPTQALLDLFTIREAFGAIDGLSVAIVGDVRHSRVARSNVAAFKAFGAEVTLVAPATLMPDGVEEWDVRVTSRLDDVLDTVDVLYMLRLQNERMEQGLVPSVGEYAARFGLDANRASRLRPDARVMHPGPMNRGVEMLVDPAALPGSLIRRQVRNGVPVRMAVLFDALAGPQDEWEAT